MLILMTMAARESTIPSASIIGFLTILRANSETVEALGRFNISRILDIFTPFKSIS
jgi:hypothetical protein